MLIHPPLWTQKKTESVKTITGEVGVLIYVHSTPNIRPMLSGHRL